MQTGASQPLSLNPTGTLSRRHTAHFVSAIDNEVTSVLDVTIQAQILDLFKKLRESMNLSIILISHDQAVVRHLCERVAVMRHGQLVKYGTTMQIFSEPRETYTRELLAAIPRIAKSLQSHETPVE